MKYFAYLLLLLIVGGSIFYLSKYESDSSNTITVVGKIFPGVAIDKSYCGDALYIVPDTLVYPTLQLRDIKLKLITDNKKIGSVVEIKGTYDKELGTCAALTCDCDPFIKVETLSEEILKNQN